jgi:hypothetical protein
MKRLYELSPSYLTTETSGYFNGCHIGWDIEATNRMSMLGLTKAREILKAKYLWKVPVPSSIGTKQGNWLPFVPYIES